jgi:uncharacterized membrane protein (UPF0127 family)
LASAEVATTRSERRRGLRGRDGVEGALVIPHCQWVHTLGMRFPIDVAYVDGEGVVVKMVRMRRWRLGAPVRDGAWLIEAAVGAFERWGLSVGDVVELRGPDADAEAAGGDDTGGPPGP